MTGDYRKIEIDLPLIMAHKLHIASRLIDADDSIVLSALILANYDSFCGYCDYLIENCDDFNKGV